VPVQRPAALDGEAPPAAEPESESEPEPEPAPGAEPVGVEDVVVDREATSDPLPPDPATARIVGTLVDTEVADAALPRVRVEAVCTCLDVPRVVFTDAKGRFELERLPAGVYTIVATRGGQATREIVAIGQGDAQAIELRVGPPTTTAELDSRDFQRQRAQTLIAIGGVAEIGALVMLLAAAIEQRKPDCKFDRSDCADPPRPAVTMGLGIGGGILALTGAALLGVGIHRLRKLNARIAIDDRTVGFTLSGNF
jgi:hypothetical protein